MFDELDRNGNGSITKSELKKNGYCKEDIASFFRTYDLDSKHKEVSKAEYLTIMFEALITSMNKKQCIIRIYYLVTFYAQCLELCLIIFNLGVSGGLAGWTIALPDFDRIEGATGYQQRAALLLAHPAWGSHLRP